jgi:hypothetical protein
MTNAYRAASATRRPPRPDWQPGEPPYVIVPCSAAKAPGAHLRAVQRYTGSFYRLAMATALNLTEPAFIRIASARYGLLTVEDDTEPYDLRLDRLGRDDLRTLWSRAHGAACDMWGAQSPTGRPGAPVLLLTPRFYTEQLLTVPLVRRNAVTPLPFADCGGIGEMRHVLTTYTWPPAA